MGGLQYTITILISLSIFVFLIGSWDNQTTNVEINDSVNISDDVSTYNPVNVNAFYSLKDAINFDELGIYGTLLKTLILGIFTFLFIYFLRSGD